MISEYLAGGDPSTVAAGELAVALSPAAFVEPALIRAVRLEALPHLSVEAEADLWVSPLILDRTPEGLSFAPEALPLLHRRLRSWLDEGGVRGERARRAAAVILGRAAPELRLVAERVTWWALSVPDERLAAARIDDALAPVMADLRAGDLRVARWVRRTLPTLPEPAQAAAAVGEARERASSLTRRPIGSPVRAPTEPDLPRIDVGVRRRGGTLQVGTFAARTAHGIEVPATQPLWVEVVAGGRTQVLTFRPGQSRSVEVGRGRVELRTLSGDVYRLDAVKPSAPYPAEPVVGARDIVVVIPGLFGSELSRGDEVIWTGGRDTLRELAAVRNQTAHSDSSVRPGGLVRTPLLVPGLWSVGGYEPLWSALAARAGVQEHRNLVAFTWDWRLDMRVAAQRLLDTVENRLAEWRDNGGGDRESRVVLIGHAEGGLVASHYLGLLGGWDRTRLFIPIATPFRGTVRALEFLVNGAAIDPVLVEFVHRVRPLHQVQPIDPVVDLGTGILARPSDVDLPRAVVDTDNFLDALAGPPSPPDSSLVAPIVGIGQDTAATAQLVSGRLRIRTTANGDGVVPIRSAQPPYQVDDRRTFFTPGRRGYLAGDPRVVEYVTALLDARDVSSLGRTRTPSAPTAASIDIADHFRAGEPVTGIVRAESRSDVTLRVDDVWTGRRVLDRRVPLRNELTPFTLEVSAEPGRLFRVSVMFDAVPMADADFMIVPDGF
jgi:lecithin:cholesterol acyltransferase